MVVEGCIVAGRSRGVVAWLVVALVLVAACGTAAEEGSEPSGGLPQDLLAQIAQAEGMVAEILADGWVTDAELERAFLATLACIEEAGFEVTGSIDWTTGSFGIDLHGLETAEIEEAAVTAMHECKREYFDLVGGVHAYQNRLSEMEVAERFHRIAECLRQRGVTVPLDTAESVFEATADGEAAILYGECHKAVVGG